MAQHTDKTADAAIALWEQMASQVVAIVGDGGFNSLYTRSVFMTRAAFPWLPAESLPPQPEHHFKPLKASLQGQTPAQASEASCLLLLNFTDILAALIGEQLTISILRSAWGNHPSNKAGEQLFLTGHPKELTNE